MQVIATRAYRGRTNGILTQLAPGDVVPEHLVNIALTGGWGEAVKPAKAKPSKRDDGKVEYE